MKRSDYPLVHGVGINDANYSVRPSVIGKRPQCAFYSRWERMLFRCYGDPALIKRPTYKGCTVCDEWLVFSNFKSWMEKQSWEGKVIDKDIIVSGNKIYSPDTCALVDQKTNLFVTDRGAKRGDFLIGVGYIKSSGKFAARCGNPFTGVQEYLGCFSLEIEAHEAWRSRKHELSQALAMIQEDKRVAAALLVKYRN